MAQRKKGASPASQQMQFNNALMADVRALRLEIAKGRNAQPSQVRKKKAGRQKGGGRGQGAAMNGGAFAAVRTRLAFVGLQDKGSLVSSYTAGFVLIGNGTNGVANEVLFLTSDGNHLYPGDSVAPVVPILPGDSVLGKSYITDESKHFSRRRYRKLFLHIDSLQPNTNAAMVLVVAPVRGSAQSQNSTPVALATSTAHGATIDSVRSMKGNIYMNSFDDSARRTTLDMTPFIAGGFGPKQDEFAVPSVLKVTTCVSDTTPGQNVAGPFTGLSPCGFIVAGQNTIAGNQAVKMFEIIVEMHYDLLDFTGGTAIPNPLG